MPERSLWQSDIHCWEGFPANFDAAGEFFPDFPAAPHAIPAKVSALSGLENQLCIRKPSWIFSSETATAFLSFSDLRGDPVICFSPAPRPPPLPCLCYCQCHWAEALRCLQPPVLVEYLSGAGRYRALVTLKNVAALCRALFSITLWPKNGKGGLHTVHCKTVAYLPCRPVALDNRQITHLICVRLKHLLYDFLEGVLGLFPVVFLYKRTKTPPKRVI